MQIHLHQTHHDIADFHGIFNTFKFKLNGIAENHGIHLFPELFLTGYPLADLVVQRPFIDSYLKFLKQIDAWSTSLDPNPNINALIGGLDYHFDDQNLPEKVRNVAFHFTPGVPLKVVYTKILLPNYDIFDEEKYFTPGDTPSILELNGLRIGLLICEDMWVSSHHSVDPVQQLQNLIQSTNPVDLVVNLSGSPFHLGKESKRHSRGKEISSLLQAPFFYVNRVGGEDEVLFDGGSFAVNSKDLIYKGNLFHEDSKRLVIPDFLGITENKEIKNQENTWEDLFKANLNRNTTPVTLNTLLDEDMEVLLHGLAFGLQEYARKCGFNKFLVALSGGIDSTLALTIAKLALKPGQEIEAIYMPSIFSASISYELSKALCENLQIPLKSLPIKFFHSSIKHAFSDNIGSDLEGLADENIQSRLRAALLYARSNQSGAMTLNTSNKSEIAVGYSTLYGDSVGAISILGDLYKTEIFELCRFINKKFENIIPEGIITREPSAELRENQTDSQSLPTYERLDAMLEGILSYRLSLKELHELGFTKKEINKVYGLYTKSEYKRRQFCPIIKVRAKSFGFGYRVPICKSKFVNY
ncbi:MAG: NAD(+) synthase [Bacteriovoracaceae bacterium]|jgi:NAD+ synthase (glutamine-hydrolysing)|nr:NAD(+) synthase [Bacteriovoracaceae bacterium]